MRQLFLVWSIVFVLVAGLLVVRAGDSERREEEREKEKEEEAKVNVKEEEAKVNVKEEEKGKEKEDEKVEEKKEEEGQNNKDKEQDNTIESTIRPYIFKSSNYTAADVVDKDPVELIKLRGFEAELHYATTPDGYKLHLVRVVHPLIRAARLPLKRPIIFNHGFLECSTIWLVNAQNVRPTLERANYCSELNIDEAWLNARNDSINGPFLLANQGYDVWLMSMRGTDYSQGHTSLSPKEAKFWDFSLDDFALGDVPTVIEFVLDRTGAPKVAYAGHSQATFAIFGLLATRPKFNQLVEPIFAVAPVAYMHHITSVARPLFVSSLAVKPKHGPFPKESSKWRKGIGKVCMGKLGAKFACQLIDGLIGGRGLGAKPGQFSHLPFSSSLKVVRHFGQLVTKRQMTRHDHGKEENLRRYGSEKAPLYEIGKITSPSLCLFATKTDSLSDPADVRLFKRQLKVPLMRDVFIEEKLNHFDMLRHSRARHWVFGPMLELLEQVERVGGDACRKPSGKSYAGANEGSELEEEEQEDEQQQQQQEEEEEENDGRAAEDLQEESHYLEEN